MAFLAPTTELFVLATQVGSIWERIEEPFTLEKLNHVLFAEGVNAIYKVGGHVWVVETAMRCDVDFLQCKLNRISLNLMFYREV